MSTNIDRGVRAFCPDCGANVRTEVGRCWLCFRALPRIADSAAGLSDEFPVSKPKSEPVADPSKRAGGGGRQFSLATVLLVMTLVAVCLGVYRLWPGAGIVVTLMAAPALLATIALGAEKRQRGYRPTIGEKIGTFLGLFGVIVLAAVTALVALLTACGGLAVAAGAPTGLPAWQAALLLLAGIGIISVAMAAVNLLAQVLRPPRRR